MPRGGPLLEPTVGDRHAGECISAIYSLGYSYVSSMQSDDLVDAAIPQPRETIDLGALVTEDLPERIWGKALLADNNFSETNSFNVIRWEQDLSGGTISGSNSYYTLFNHGGPHVDAANHIGLLYTGYKPPPDDQSYPEVVTLTREAALYLSGIPIRAIGTDSQSLYSYQDTRPVGADTVLARAAPTPRS